MSWVKKGSNVSINSVKSSIGVNSNRNNNSYLKDFDLSACYDSFKKHWQQIYEIIRKYDLNNSLEPKHDDVLTVVNHLNQVLTLIQVELRSENVENSCIEYLFDENYLEDLCSWTVNAQKYSNSLRVEQLRIYEILLSSLHQQLLRQEVFLKPLIRLLSSFNGDCLPVDIEKKLVILINQLCSSFSQQPELFNLLFPSNSNKCNESSRFDIFSFLVHFVHRDGVIGEQARDSLLLCISISKNNDKIAEYITSKSNICPVLAAGLNGLYSLLPRKLTFESLDWFRFAADDVYEIKELTNFMNSLVFCNVIIQVCHPSIAIQLFDYIYQGFMVRVMGPALLQSTEEELVATTAYFELLIRSVTHPGLLQAFIKFLIQEDMDGQHVIDCLVQRLIFNTKLCVVTLSLFETLLELNCEDLMLEMIFQHLIPCTHIMYSQRSRIRTIDPYCNSARKFIELMINVPRSVNNPIGDYHVYLKYARERIHLCSKQTKSWTYLYDGKNPSQSSYSVSKHDDYNKFSCDGDVEHNSLPSVDDGSSGYESFKMFKDNDRTIGSEEYNGLDDRSRTNPPSPCGSETTLEQYPDFSRIMFPRQHQLSNLSPRKHPLDDSFVNVSCIGPLLHTIFQKLEDLINCDLHIILRLTGFISRLAIYPQPLIYSFLLDHSLIFQPCIKSLIQVLGLLKQKIESRFSKINDLSSIVNEAETFLNERFETLSRSRKQQNGQSNNLTGVTNIESFCRNDNKRSLSVAIGAMFRRNLTQGHVESIGDDCFRFMKGDQDQIRHVVVCSIIINEWLKELAAICQEHSRVRSDSDSQLLEDM